jgi:DNA-binding response OmpR family regulator
VPVHRILIADEDPATRRFLADNLRADGYDVTVAADSAEALRELTATTVSLVICDLNGATLPLIDRMRRDKRPGDVGVPVVVLTSRSDELARVRVFERGGDDVVVKPFSYPEVRGRVRALLRRTYARASQSTRIGALTIDTASREVRLDGRLVDLSAKEFDLVRTLAGQPTRVFTKDELLRDIWGIYHGNTRTLDSHACRLRRKLSTGSSKYVINVWGVGYRLADPLLYEGDERDEPASRQAAA